MKLWRESGSWRAKADHSTYWTPVLSAALMWLLRSCRVQAP